MKVSVVMLEETDGVPIAKQVDEDKVLALPEIIGGEWYEVIGGEVVRSIEELREPGITVVSMTETDGDPLCVEMAPDKVTGFIETESLNHDGLIFINGPVWHPYGAKMSPWLGKQKQAQARARKTRQ